MPRITQKMPPPPSVSPSSTATFRLPIGRTYHNLHLVAGGTAMDLADITEIRVLANSKIIQRFSATDREKMNLFEGRATATVDANNFTLCIPFDRFNILTRSGEEETGIATGTRDPVSGVQIDTFNVEIDVGAAVTAPTLAMYAETSENDPTRPGPGTIPSIVKIVRDYSSATLYDWSDIPRQTVEQQAIEQIHMIPSTGNLTGSDIRIEANSYVVFERSDALNRRIQKDGVREPVAGMYSIDRTEFGYMGDLLLLNGLSDFRVKFTTSAAMTITSYVKYNGTLGG